MRCDARHRRSFDPTLRRGADVGGVERQPGEGEPADQIAEHGRDLVPDQIVEDRELGVQHQARRKQEHVHHRMFEHHVKEHQDRHPHRQHLARHRGRDHRHHHAGRDHPVAQHAAEEQRRHAGRAVRRIAERPPLADIADHRADLVGILRKAEGGDERHQERHRQRAGEVADEHQAPIAQHAANRDAGTLIEPRQRRQHEYAGEQIEAEQIQHGEADREQQCADQRLAGIDVDRDREPRGERQNGAGHIGANHRVARRHEDLGLASVDHLGDEFRRREVGHLLRAPFAAEKAASERTSVGSNKGRSLDDTAALHRRESCPIAVCRTPAWQFSDGGRR